MSKFCIQAGWAHAPHLNEQAKADLMASVPEHERDARMNGKPSMGAGAIYPVSEEIFVVPDFPLPDFFPRCYGLDVGFRRTAAIFLAHDQDADIVYAYSEHYAGESIPAVHAEALKSRADWTIPGVIDPAAQGRSQIDGQKLIELYATLGLDLEPAINGVSAGIYAVWQRLVGGKLKVFASLANLRQEMSMYRRDEKGKIVKTNDHACDALRYAIMSGLERAKTRPVKRSPYSSGGRVFSG